MTTPWSVIKGELVANGQMSEQGVTRTPRPRHCRHCGRVVIAAITDLGFEVAVEPTPTTPLGELAVLFAGGETYWLADHGELVWRSRHRIAYRNADEEQTHALHRCDKPPSEMNERFRRRTIAEPLPDNPPY